MDCGDGYFVLGDDSRDSDDSRFNAPVSPGDVVGRAWLILAPENTAGSSIRKIMAMTEQISPEPRRPRQFTLGGPMLFVVGWSAYFSMIGAAWSWVGNIYPRYDDSPRPNVWLMGATVAGCWIVLWFLYRRWGLRHALKVHYAGPMIFTPLSLFLAALGVLARQTMDPTILLLPLLGALYGCFISILIGFPIAVIMLFFVVPPFAGPPGGRLPPRGQRQGLPVLSKHCGGQVVLSEFALWQRFPKHWRLRSSTIKPAGCKPPSRSIGRFSPSSRIMPMRGIFSA